MPDNSCAIIFSNPERIRSGDVDFEYHQNPDFFYLTGLEESNSILLIWKENRAIEGIQTHELIFVQPSNKLQEIWTGKTIGVSGAMTELGISLAFSSEDFEMIDGCFNGLSKILYTGFPKGLVNDRKTSSDLSDLVEAFKLKSNYPSSLHDDYALGKILRSMREVKLPEEILLMKKANSISIVAHREMMKAIRPGLTEFQIQAIGEYFLNRKVLKVLLTQAFVAQQKTLAFYIIKQISANSTTEIYYSLTWVPNIMDMLLMSPGHCQ